jgi:hypothetical protein
MTEDSMTARLLHIGRDLQSRLRGFFEVPLGPGATPLELLQAALDELERKIQPAGRGRRIFPYDRVVVQIAQPGVDPVAVDAVFRDLEARLRERLEELRCEAPERIDASVSLADAPAEGQGPLLRVECSREGGDHVEPASLTRRPPVGITVVKGQCDEPEYVFDEPVIAIGRTAEPTDALGQVRHNHVAFVETRDGVTETVGRAHARLQFDPALGHYHLFNESGSNPTSIVRSGRTIRVAPRDPRGVRVESGDQLQLGRAVLTVTIG